MNSFEPKISVVLPIYNVETYLNRCIVSIVNQSYKNIEIILIDDGSFDKSKEICDERGKKDSRIIVFHKENEGLGMARNSGIKFASGDYIMFIDSDDFVELDTIDKCVKKLLSDKTDTVVFGMKIYENNKIIKEYPNSATNGAYYGDEIMNTFVPHLLSNSAYKNEKWFLWPCAWNTMFSLRIIKEHNFEFASERVIISEDYYSLLTYYKFAGGVSILSDCLYFYCVNKNSLTRKFKSDRFEMNTTFYKLTVAHAKSLQYPEEAIKRINVLYLNNIIGCFKLLVSSNNSFKFKYNTLFNYLNDKFFQSRLSEVNLKEETFSRALLFFLMRHRITFICFILLKAKGQ